MKKKWFLLCLLFQIFYCYGAEKVSLEEELKSISLELYAAGSYDFDGITAGGKFLLPFSEVRVYGNGDKWTYGLSLFSDKINSKFPFRVKFGKISAGGSLSKMNSPVLSTGVSPFSSAWTSVQGLECYLPGTSGFSKPLGAFVQSKYVEKKGIVKTVSASAYYDLEQIFTASMYSKLSFGDVVKTEISGTAGIFPYEEKKLTGWFNTEKYYPCGNIFCSNLQTNIVTKRYSALMMAGFYENPFGKFVPLYRFENKITQKPFVINLSCFVSPADEVITSSDNKIDSCVQFKAGLVYAFTTLIGVPVFFKSGINFYGKINLKETTDDVKIGAGIQGSCSFTALSVYFYASGEIDSQNIDNIKLKFKGVSAQGKNTWYFNSVTFSINESLSLTPDSKYEIWTTVEKTSVSFILDLMPRVTHSANISFTQKNKEHEKTVIGTDILFKFSLGKAGRIKCSLKFSADYTMKAE